LIVGGLLILFGGKIQFPDWLPTPVPTPVVLDEGAWIIVVEETAQRSPEVAKVFAAADFWDGLKARGLNWRAYDDDAPEAAKYVEKVKDRPGVLITDKAGKVVRAGPLPTPIEKLDSLVKEATGR
jgi:hypothetical protein